MSSLGSGESKLETIISYLLIIGVIISLVLVVAGIVMLYSSTGSLDISQSKAFFIQGQNFFSFLGDLFGGHKRTGAVMFITMGITTLILTPYLRVIASALYFAWRKDVKYVVITAFVLVVLTLSLALH